MRKLATGIALALAVATAAAAGAATAPTFDAHRAEAAAPAARFSYVLRAGRYVQAIGNLLLRGRNRRYSVTYADAIRAFGKPSWCRAFGRGTTALARWRRLGVRLRLATLGGLPPGKNGCTAPRSIHVDTAIVSGSRWRTTLGLQVGDAVEDLLSLYPNAIYQRRPPGYWLVHVRERCVIGICPRPYIKVPRLIAQVKAGKVAAFVFPVGAQGE